jgi:amino acid transporter
MLPDRLCAVTFRRALGPFDATMVVIGGIIGSGIFINPYIVAQRLDSSLLVLGAWAAGGAIALAGAFAYAELGALFPKAGGQYVYLRDGWHPLAGFLYGWALLLVIESGAIAAVAITFATYALRLVGRPDVAPIPLAVAAIAVLSIVNYLGVKPGSRVLNVLVVLKVAALGRDREPAAEPAAQPPRRHAEHCRHLHRGERRLPPSARARRAGGNVDAGGVRGANHVRQPG